MASVVQHQIWGHVESSTEEDGSSSKGERQGRTAHAVNLSNVIYRSENSNSPPSQTANPSAPPPPPPPKDRGVPPCDPRELARRALARDRPLVEPAQTAVEEVRRTTAPGRSSAAAEGRSSRTKKVRPNKQNRNLCKQALQMLELQERDEDKLAYLEELSEQSPYMKSICGVRIQELIDNIQGQTAGGKPATSTKEILAI